MMKTTSLGVLALVLASGAAAQTPAPARAPDPPPPAQPTAPALQQPARATPPTSAAAASAAPQAQAAVTTEPVRPMTRTGTPVDSARPQAAASRAMPANAVAQCVDGTFVVAPGTAASCASHRGVLVRFPSRTPPPRPVAAAPAGQLAAPRPAAASSPATAPAGSTMQCKDGTFLSGPATASRCDAYGGLAALLPAPRPSPPTPAAARQP